MPLPTLPLSSQKEEGRADAEGKQCSQYSTEEFEGESVPALRSAAHAGDASSRGRRRRRNACFPARLFKTGNGTRYVHPGEAHRADAVQKLEVANVAKEIAEAEKKEAKAKAVPTISPTEAENPTNFSEEKTKGKSQRIN